MDDTFPEKEVTIQITDMESYSSRTGDMTPAGIRDFVIDYHTRLKNLITAPGGTPHYNAIAGDASVALYTGGEDARDNSSRAVKKALEILDVMRQNRLLPTRIGLFAGTMIEAEFGHQRLNFGNSFAAAARLEQLCGYFGTYLLMDREVARADDAESRYAVNIGKVTPKNFNHPIHVFSFYKPGINRCPEDVNEASLMAFIEQKNEAMESFTGNALKGIAIDFPRARAGLLDALRLFHAFSGTTDPPTELILGYLAETAAPTEEFIHQGMRISSSSFYRSRSPRLKLLPEKLLKRYDMGLHEALVLETEWTQHFKLEYFAAGTLIIKQGEKPDGVYFIESGAVEISNENNAALTRLAAGEIFGEMAYFTPQGVRMATVKAVSDLVVWKISDDDLQRFPSLKNILRDISGKRLNAG